MWCPCQSHLPSFFTWWQNTCHTWGVSAQANPFPPLTHVQYEHVDFMHGRDATPAVAYVVVPSWGEQWMLFAFWNQHMVRWHPHRVVEAQVWCDPQPKVWPYPAHWEKMIWLAEEGPNSIWLIHDLLMYQGAMVYHRIWHYTQRMFAIQSKVMDTTVSADMGWNHQACLLPAELYEHSFLGLHQGWYSALLACGFVMKPVYTLPVCDESVLHRYRGRIHGMMLYAAHTIQEWAAAASPQQLFWALHEYYYLTVRTIRPWDTARMQITWYETEDPSYLNHTQWSHRALSAEKRDVVLCCSHENESIPLHPVADPDVITTVNHVMDQDVMIPWSEIHHL